MTLSRDQTETLLKTLALTKDEEVMCDSCMREIAEFAETQLKGKSIPDSLKVIEDHLELSGECREEFEALMAALRGSTESDKYGK